MRGSCNRSCATRPKAPPKRPPMTSAGAKSPALPPDPMVSEAETIFAKQRNSSRPAPAQPIGNQLAPLIATCTAP